MDDANRPIFASAVNRQFPDPISCPGSIAFGPCPSIIYARMSGSDSEIVNALHMLKTSSARNQLYT
jgi:hypothetical protein